MVDTGSPGQQPPLNPRNPAEPPWSGMWRQPPASLTWSGQSYKKKRLVSSQVGEQIFCHDYGGQQRPGVLQHLAGQATAAYLHVSRCMCESHGPDATLSSLQPDVLELHS